MLPNKRQPTSQEVWLVGGVGRAGVGCGCTAQPLFLDCQREQHGVR